jgi:hypothetical protein
MADVRSGWAPSTVTLTGWVTRTTAGWVTRRGMRCVVCAGWVQAVRSGSVLPSASCTVGLAKAQAEAPTICVKRPFYFRYTYSTASVRKCFHAALSRYGLQPSKSMRLNVM